MREDKRRREERINSNRILVLLVQVPCFTCLYFLLLLPILLLSFCPHKNIPNLECNYGVRYLFNSGWI